MRNTIYSAILTFALVACATAPSGQQGSVSGCYVHEHTVEHCYLSNTTVLLTDMPFTPR